MNPKQTLIAAVLAGIGASLCCVAPLLLLSLGIGGAWVATLTAFEPWRPIFLGFAALFIGLLFRKLYLTNPACETGKPCAEEEVIRKQRKNMTCAVCPLTVKKALEGVAGVQHVSVSYADKTATVEFDNATATPDQLTEATKNTGYPSSVQAAPK